MKPGTWNPELFFTNIVVEMTDTMSKLCPNYNGCRLVQTDNVVNDAKRKADYISAYCQNEETWKDCRRYITRKSLWMCPDFVLPDSEMTEDEIIEHYEQEEENNKQ